MGERVLEVLLSVSLVAGALSVSTMLERCAASGAVGKYNEPRCPHPANANNANKLKDADTMLTFFCSLRAILLPWLD
jgi:hypothetical protein